MSNNQKKLFPVGTTFGIEGVPDSIKVEGLAKPSPMTPQVEHHVFDTDFLSDVLAWMRIGGSDGLLIKGPTGSGKTSGITQVFARLNLPLVQVTCHADMEIPELVGHQTVVDGDLVFMDGPLTTAMRMGRPLLMNEIDYLNPGTASGLNQILDGGYLIIPENGGEVVKPAEGFKLIATANTAGGGDETGMYLGTQQQNMALMDRFWVLELGYMKPEAEEAVVQAAAPKLNAPVVAKMVEMANQVRSMFMGENSGNGAIEVTMSTRTLVRWAKMSVFFGLKAKKGINPIEYSLERALGNRASPETREALRELCQRHFDGL